MIMVRGQLLRARLPLQGIRGLDIESNSAVKSHAHETAQRAACKGNPRDSLFYLFIYKINLFIYLFIFGCVGSSLLRTGFL